MALDEREGRGELRLRHPDGGGQFHGGLQPDFRFAVRMGHVDMQAGFFSGKEEEPVWTFSQDRRRHLFSPPGCA